MGLCSRKTSSAGQTIHHSAGSKRPLCVDAASSAEPNKRDGGKPSWVQSKYSCSSQLVAAVWYERVVVAQVLTACGTAYRDMWLLCGPGLQPTCVLAEVAGKMAGEPASKAVTQAHIQATPPYRLCHKQMLAEVAAIC